MPRDALAGGTQAVHSVSGDLLALSSAVGYAVYTTLLQRLLGGAKDTDSTDHQAPSNDKAEVDMAAVFGWIGLFDALTLWPIGLAVIDRFGWESLPWQDGKECC